MANWRGKPISSCCPFCLSEHWDVLVELPLRGSVLMKVLSIPLTLIMFTLLFGASNELASYMGGSAIVQWIGVIGSIVATYKFGRWFVN